MLDQRRRRWAGIVQVLNKIVLCLPRDTYFFDV